MQPRKSIKIGHTEHRMHYVYALFPYKNKLFNFLSNLFPWTSVELGADGTDPLTTPDTRRKGNIAILCDCTLLIFHN